MILKIVDDIPSLLFPFLYRHFIHCGYFSFFFSYLASSSLHTWCTLILVILRGNNHIGLNEM